MDLVIIPYHDLRKIKKEGNRTRDAHFIESFTRINSKGNVLIINRPITYLEIFVKRYRLNLEGETILKKGSMTLLRIDKGSYAIDYRSKDVLSLILHQKGWFLKAFAKKTFNDFVKECMTFLAFKDAVVISQNIFAYKIFEQKIFKLKVFDSWDNFTRMPGFNRLKSELLGNYRSYSQCSDLIITNSKENVDFYKREFNRDDVKIVQNGVNPEVFSGSYPEPEDLKSIDKPIVGFGGKITHLFDVDLFNYLTENNPDKSFIVIGQVLDKTVFKKIRKSSNFYYLGDKHYDIYPSYITNFDYCIVPYVINEKQHGGDSIKAYEYLSAKKIVIGTNGNGLQNLSNSLYIAKSKEEFNQLLNKKLDTKPFDVSKHSWDHKAKLILSELKNLIK